MPLALLIGQDVTLSNNTVNNATLSHGFQITALSGSLSNTSFTKFSSTCKLSSVIHLFSSNQCHQLRPYLIRVMQRDVSLEFICQLILARNRSSSEPDQLLKYDYLSDFHHEYRLGK